MRLYNEKYLMFVNLFPILSIPFISSSVHSLLWPMCLYVHCYVSNFVKKYLLAIYVLIFLWNGQNSWPLHLIKLGTRDSCLNKSEKFLRELNLFTNTKYFISLSLLLLMSISCLPCLLSGIYSANHITALPGSEADNSSSSAKVKNAWSHTFTSPYVFMAWCLIKHRILLHGVVLS
jgi:hypothetical protein